MGRKKNSGAGGCLSIVAIGFLFLLSKIPFTGWLLILACVIIGYLIYRNSKKTNLAAQAVDETGSISRSLTSVSSRGFVVQNSVTATKPIPVIFEAKIAEDKAEIGARIITPINPTKRPDPDHLISIAISNQTSHPDFWKVPDAPDGQGPAKWIPYGQSVVIAGVTIPNGMIYLGSSLPTSNGPYASVDPCLIDPSRLVASRGDFTVQVGYWPSYTEISPSARRTYLDWLAEGRNRPDVDIGYVFIFFYGLERRVIIDAKNVEERKDLPFIADELKRLLSIYGGKSGSFFKYASGLLSWIELASNPTKLYEKPIPDLEKNYFEIPIYVRLALGQAAIDGVAVPSQLALSWMKLDPNTYLRTPAVRCPDEFSRLFEIAYAQTFGNGMVLPRNRTKLKYVYQPASSAFRGSKEINLNFDDIPDVTVLAGPVEKLRQIVAACTTELEYFSSYVRRNPEGKSSFEGLLQLPTVLWPEAIQQSLLALEKQVASEIMTLTFDELFAKLTGKFPLSKESMLGLARVFESIDIGIEPDFLGGAKVPKIEDKIVLFALRPNEAIVREMPAYQAALITLQLAATVADADGKFCDAEYTFLRENIRSWKHLTASYQQRLQAHLQLLRVVHLPIVSLKKKIDSLDQTKKETIAVFIAMLAHADGQVTPPEIKVLEKIYKSLDIDPDKVFSNIHAVATGGAPSVKSGESIFKLNPKRIAELQKDTEKVSTLLASIFNDEENQPKTFETELESEKEPSPSTLLGLDATYSSLARKLLSRPQWARQELQDVAADLDLMLDGALEHINDASFNTFNVPFFEGEDPIEINTEVMEKIES